MKKLNLELLKLTKEQGLKVREMRVGLDAELKKEKQKIEKNQR